MVKTYCALGLGNNFFHPLGIDSIPIPSHLLQEKDEDCENTTSNDAIKNNTKGGVLTHNKLKTDLESGDDTTAISTDQAELYNKLDIKDSSEDDDIIIEEEEDNNNNEHHHDENVIGTNVSLLPINPHVSTLSSGDDDIDEHDHHFNSASEWLKLHLPSTENNDDIDKKKMKKKYNKYSTNIQPKVSCGVTHTSFIIAKEGTAAVGNGGEAYLVGTIFGRTYQKLTIQPTRLPLKIIRISSGRRHVLALTEGSATSPSFGSSGGGGGVVLSWGAGHFGQLGHGPDLTSCLEPRIIERLLPHVVGGHIIEIAAGGLHSAAIVASNSSSSKNNVKVFPSPFVSNTTNGDASRESIVIRETKTFAWGSNRKGQCGIEGGKCATVPEPLPVVLVKRGEMSKSGSSNSAASSSSTTTDPVDKNVHFEKLSLGRLHTVALTAYGEVFTWGSTSMGRCGHNSMDSGRGSDRRFVQQPRHVSALRNVAIESIAAGAAHTLALSKGGRVFAWGAGSDGQCGQGHAGNLFSPRAVHGLPGSVGSKAKVTTPPKIEEPEGQNMPHVNSKVAMAVTMEEEALSKALSMSQITNVTPPLSEPKAEKIVSIRASGCYSAAITGEGEIYTWGYGSGAAIGHPIPSEETSSLPLIPIIEGNQYSTTTAAKVYPEGGSDENKIRDCRCFDTDLNIMLPRKVECTKQLGLRVEDVALGPGHMVILCSMGDNSDDDNGPSNNSVPGQLVADDAHTGEERNQSGGSVDGLSSLKDDDTSNQENSAATTTAGDISTVTTFESNDSSKSEKRRRSPGWMTKIKSSRTNKQQCSTNTTQSSSANMPDSAERKRSSITQMSGKVLDAARSAASATIRRGGEKS